MYIKTLIALIIGVLGIVFFGISLKYFISFRGNMEAFQDPLYLKMRAIVVEDESSRFIHDIENEIRCRNECTQDEKCASYTYNSISQICNLNYNHEKYKSNKEGLYTIPSGIKKRPIVGTFEDSIKYYRNEGMRMPFGNTGTLQNNNYVKTLSDCQTKCLQNKDCIAFTYDFKDHTCEIAREINGALTQDVNKDTYLIIN